MVNARARLRFRVSVGAKARASVKNLDSGQFKYFS